MFRPPTGEERQIIKYLAELAPHASEYLRQVENCMVRITNENDDLEISVSQGLPVVQADIVIGPSYYLSEAIYRDTDAYIVSLMLHGGSGKLFWIEHYKPMPLPVVKKWPSTDLLVPGGEADISKWEEALRDRGL